MLNGRFGVNIIIYDLRNKLKLLMLTCSQVISQAQNGPKLLKQRNCKELGAHSQLLTLKGVKGRAEALGWD
jgi:hypothetical protein